ncbi:MAG: enoyl-CoA hydratase-related protein [Bdellovibrionales bacterium]|nr:enoyl-CoA hydratase-related protein [Bdellovibrionales bacterium]
MSQSWSGLTRIKVSAEGKILKVVLARPEVRNAFDATTIEELTGIFRSIGSDVSAVVLSGEGASFCSGADLSYMQSMAKFSQDENRDDAEKLFEMFRSVRECDVPVVVHVHGHAMGGALGITACADIALAEVGTKFRFSEVRLGILPAVISPFVLQKMDSLWARRWMMTGEMFDAEQAQKAGLLHFVGTADAVRREKEAVVAAILEAGPEAVRYTKRLLGDIGQSDPTSVRSRVTGAIAERRTSKEGQEGLQAFLSKREPNWRV